MDHQSRSDPEYSGRKKRTETDLFIWISTEIFEIFGIIESTHRLVFPAIVQIKQSQRSLIEMQGRIAEIVLAAMIWKGSTHHGGS